MLKTDYAGELEEGSVFESKIEKRGNPLKIFDTLIFQEGLEMDSYIFHNVLHEVKEGRILVNFLNYLSKNFPVILIGSEDNFDFVCSPYILKENLKRDLVLLNLASNTNTLLITQKAKVNGGVSRKAHFPYGMVRVLDKRNFTSITLLTVVDDIPVKVFLNVQV